MTDASLAPETDWDYALSSADELVLAHLADDPASGVRERQASVVVMLAAAVYACAHAQRRRGPDTAQTVVQDVVGYLRENVVREVVAAAPAPGGRGREQQQVLTGEGGRGDEELLEAARGAGEVLHSALRVTPDGTLADWAAAHHRRRRAEILGGLADQYGTED